MRVFTDSAQDIREIAELLLRGEVVAIPTETVYGLAANALNPEAVKEIYRIKGRPSHNPLIAHIHDPAIAGDYVRLNATAERLIDAFWPGPLTLVLPKTPIIPGIVTAELPTLAIRMPDHPLMLSVLKQLGRPIAAPSANPSNYISPTRVEHVIQGLEGRLKYVLDGKSCARGVESTILNVCDPAHIKLLRPGPITLEQIETVIGMKVETGSIKTLSASVLTSPGQMKSHYRPHTPLTIGKSTQSEPIAYVHFSQSGDYSPMEGHYFLTRQLDSREAEANLYDLLQKLDRANYREIVFDPVPEGENWNAIRDRLARASCRD